MMTVWEVEDQNSRDQENSSLPHVLLVLDQFPKTLGGGERIVLRLAELLPQYGYRASILTFGVHPESSIFTRRPCAVYMLPLQRTYGISALRASFDLRRFLIRHQIQIVQTFFESSDLWAGLVTKTMSDAKLIWSRRDMGILRSSKHRMAYRLMRKAPDAVFAVSEKVRRYCIDVDGIDPDRVLTIHNGLDLADWMSDVHAPNKSSEVKITTVGNIRRVKGHDILIRAAAIILREYPDVSFSIAGDVLEQDYFAELLNLIQALNLSHRVYFAGGVRDLREHLSASDIFVLPSRSEGFSNAIVEAMATALPIVATDVGGNAEAVIDGVTGFLIPPENPEALAEAIMRLLRDPTRSKRMGLAGQGIVAQRFTTDAMMNQIKATYDRLLSEADS